MQRAMSSQPPPNWSFFEPENYNFNFKEEIKVENRILLNESEAGIIGGLISKAR